MVDVRSGRLATHVKVETVSDRAGPGLSVDAIDDWLENDLIQRGILGSTLPVQQTDMLSETSSSISSRKTTKERSKRDGSSTKDIVTKRQRNTDAARRSRLRKALKLQSLENEVSELKAENLTLAGQVSSLEASQAEFASREQTLKTRIQELESQLRGAQARLRQAHYNTI
jgi:chromosome segregation ATPase